MTTTDLQAELVNQTVHAALRLILRDLNAGTVSMTTGMLMHGVGALIMSQKWKGIENVATQAVQELVQEFREERRARAEGRRS